MRDSRGFIYSTTLHGLLLFFLIFGLPHFMTPLVESEPEAMSIEILPMAPMTNVPNVEPQHQEEPKKPVEEKNVEKKAAPEVKKVEEKKVEPPIKLPDPKKPEPKKPEPKKPEPKKPEVKKKEVDPLKAILNDVKAHAKVEEGKKPTQQKTTPNVKASHWKVVDPGAPLSMSQKDAIRSQIQACWSPPVGAKDAQNLIVSLDLQYGRDGTLISAQPSSGQNRSDSFFQAALDAALRAVHRCSPLKDLPPEKYNVQDGWSEIVMTFDPRNGLQ